MLQKSLCFRVVLLVVCTVVCTNAQKTYDFIVVGAGAGGCAVTRRLVENGKFSVLLVEAGGLPNDGYDVPARAPEFLDDAETTFQIPSVPQRNVALLSNGVVPILSGRMLGGTTSLNYMWFNRGSPYDWDNWADVTGDHSWRYENMLIYFKRSENYEGDFPSEEHGYQGPITVSRPRYSPGLDFWLRAGRELGYSVGDPNGPQQQGYAPVEYSKRHGRRVSAFAGYIAPILRNPNLHLMMNTNVTEIIFQGNRAVGVSFTSSAVNATSANDNVLYANKEIILSAGTYSSPTILQRSGIGLRHVLEPANIKVLKELPTGENYQGHPAINLNFAINNASVVMDQERDLTPENLRFFNIFGDGPYSNTRGGSGQAFISSSVAVEENNDDWPDIQLVMSHSTLPWFSADELHLTARLFPGEVPLSGAVFIGRPKSRGTVRINATNVLGNPVVDLGFLSDARDVVIMLDGIDQLVHTYEETKAYSPLKPRYTPTTIPACDQFRVKSDEYWRCYMRQVAIYGCHPAGTNKMGKASDPTAVVDNELRVIGMEGVRVVDASIMPFLVNANPQAAVYAIAEKAADLILRKWQSPYLWDYGKYIFDNNQNI